MAIVMQSLQQKAVTRVILSVGHLHQKITDYFGSSFLGMEVVYEIEDVPLGTGGAIARSLKHASKDHVLVLNGDTFLDLEVDALEQMWLDTRRPIVVGRMVDDTARFGRLKHDGSGTLTAFVEKGAAGPGLVNAGAYMLPCNLFLGINNLQPPFSIETEILAPLASQGKLGLFETRGQFIDIGVPEDYHRAQKMDWESHSSVR